MQLQLGNRRTRNARLTSNVFTVGPWGQGRSIGVPTSLLVADAPGLGRSKPSQAFRGVRFPFGAILDGLVHNAYRIAVKFESMRTLTANGSRQPIEA